MSLATGLKIGVAPEFVPTNWEGFNLRRSETEALSQSQHWLTVERECSFVNRSVLAEMADVLRSAMLGFQLWAPIGWSGVIVDCWKDDGERFTVDHVHLCEGYATPRWTQALNVAQVSPESLPSLIQGTLTAIQSGFVPIVNPFRFLEIGLQTSINHRRAGTVLWMMGLDGLLGAEKQALFSKRLQKLLGTATRLFPDWTENPPTFTVADVAADMYEFRSLIAHGKEIIEKYRLPISVEVDRERMDKFATQRWSRGTLMIECTVFALLAALREIITSGLIERMRDQKNWKRWLDAPV